MPYINELVCPVHRQNDEPRDTRKWLKQAAFGIIISGGTVHTMADRLTTEQLNSLSKDELVSMMMSMQDRVESLSSRLDYLTEQIAISNNRQFGRRTEKLDQIIGQGAFDAAGNLYFNEAEALNDARTGDTEPTIAEVVRSRTPRPRGKKEADLKDIPVVVLPTVEVPAETLVREFGSVDNCRRMNDEVYKRLVYIPAGWKVEETHVAVYKSRSGKKKFVKGEAPAYLLRGSIVSPELEAAIINGKFVNALPYRRIEADFKRNGVNISEQNMASWTVKCSDRYLSRLYDHLHRELIKHHVIQVDETTVEVSKDGRDAGSKSYMWVYRTGEFYRDTPIVLYDYQKTRHHDHPKEFLQGFNGIAACDGFSGYKALAKEMPGFAIAECWAHARRKFADAVKAKKRPDRKDSLSADALKMIAAVCHADKQLKEMDPQERQVRRDKEVRPLVDAFFAWVHKTDEDKTVYMSDATRDGIRYCINQEPYLRVFLTDGEVPIDNNRAEGTIRGFTIGRKNWMMIDTVSGAKASAVIYSLVETAKLNGLNPYYYFVHLLKELPKLKQFASREEETQMMEKLLPWSEDLPENCHVRGR